MRSSRPKIPTLTPQELAIMKVVWRRGSATVRDVYDALRQSRRVAYTTVMTMMNILETKGYLQKEKVKDDRAYRYRPIRPEQTVLTQMVREFVNRVFDGATQPLLLTLVRERKLTDEEREGLLRLLKEAK
jgi:BlaI family transcriptional regulator, penicillinase repressor